MKGAAARWVDAKGTPWPLPWRPARAHRHPTDSVSFLGLWRHAGALELLATSVGALLALLSGGATIAAVCAYGELTALFVSRDKAIDSAAIYILPLFGGGDHIPPGNRSLHMDALVQDSVAFAWASGAILCTQVVLAAAAVTATNWSADRMTRRIRVRLLAAVLAQEPAYYDTHSELNVGAALSQDTEALREGCGEQVAQSGYLLGTVVSGAAVALLRGWLLALTALAVIPLALVAAAIVAKLGVRSAARETALYGAAARGAADALREVATVRAYGGERVEVDRFAAALVPAAAAARRRALAGSVGAALGWLSTYSLSALILFVGSTLTVQQMALPVDQQQYHPGALVTILFCCFMCCQNIGLLQPHIEVFSVARGAARGVFGLLARRSAICSAPHDGIKPDTFRGDIYFKDVYFNYPSRPDVKVLRGLSLHVRAGETVALVGASGCGKSTLLQLAQRLYEPDSGSVSVDGHPLTSLHLHHYRTSIGVVGQEPVLFSGSIHDNIALGCGAAARADVTRAARAANAHHFITKLPHGYDTLLSSGGGGLSGGQRQRIALARALLRRPALLLLDEPTSALDPNAERQVQAALDAASVGRTTLVVSHRLATIVNATRIVYVEQGCVREQGTHAELMALRGAYYRLVQQDHDQAHSIPRSVPQAADEEDDVVPADDVTPAPAQRSFVRNSTRLSLSASSGSVRGSSRFASPAPVAANVPAADDESVEEAEVGAVPPRALWALCAADWRLLAGGGAAALLVGAAMPSFALLFAKIYGMFSLSSGEAILSAARLYALLFLTVALLCALAAALQAQLLAEAGLRLTQRLRVALLSHYLSQEQAWFDQPGNSAGALCARLASDCAAVHGATGSRLGTALQGASTMALGVLMALPYSWNMTLVSLVSVPAVIGAIYLEGVVSRRAVAARRRALQAAAALAAESVANLTTAQSLGVESELVARYERALAADSAPRWARALAYGLCVSAPTMGYAVSLAYGGYLIARKDLPYEYAILVSEALVYGAWMVAEALSLAPSFAAARRAAARVLHDLGRQPAITDQGTHDHPNWECSGAVEARGVSFAYGGRRDAPVLRGLSLSLAAGQAVALVGRSGSGKSTVLQLLLRSYDAHQGVLLLDGVDVRALPLRTLRRQMALVAQQPALLERSVRDNIAYGDCARAVPMHEVVAAATKANVHAFIASLPMGYDTVLCGGGAALSGGQKQRVAIARALVRQPKLLLLDEATSALDVASEQAVIAALAAAAEGRSTLTVAHRAHAVRHADVIALIDHGVVVESGSHDELMARRGAYWALVREQEGASADADNTTH